MKVIYYSYPFFADCDFPLVKALQNKGVEVFYYMPLHRNFQRSSILEFKRPIRKMRFVKASKMDEMQVYKDCLDLDHLYFIQGFPKNIYWIPSWLLWFFVLLHMKSKRADIIHIDWQFKSAFENFIFKFVLGKKKVMTVHDPIMHSGQPDAEKEEMLRIRSFHWADHFILLNKLQTDEFMMKYSIPANKISYGNLCRYDSIKKVTPQKTNVQGNYILFFGSIIPYKGLEYLLKAMIMVHVQCPNLKLVIAGNGELYFDASPYYDLDYIIWKHRYIGISELAGLLKDALFVVCPYKDATQSGVVHTAFSMGKPVIATNVGTLSSDIIHDINGKLVSTCNVNELAKAIICLAQNDHLLNGLCKNIEEFNRRDDSSLIVADEYMEVYRLLLEK